MRPAGSTRKRPSTVKAWPLTTSHPAAASEPTTIRTLKRNRNPRSDISDQLLYSKRGDSYSPHLGAIRIVHQFPLFEVMDDGGEFRGVRVVCDHHDGLAEVLIE